MWLLEGENHVNYVLWKQVVQFPWLQGDITHDLCLVGSTGTGSMCGKAWSICSVQSSISPFPGGDAFSFLYSE